MYAQELPQAQPSRVTGANLLGQAASQTMAARLENAANTLAYQCDRIANVLSKINGTPRDNPPTAGGVEKIKITAPLAQSLDYVEATAKRLCDLAAALEQVA
jgi:hypothetical protein